ncbi:myb family transcription factor PHL8-like [Salvia splendens]|uniref:myb family transcription factor PHL8-like n=1 Tax=Salvia splendens TaxID=180675 RepID=UPI001C268CE7|nr:myb family transcription factor PHL8-like [Salvia splendens]
MALHNQDMNLVLSSDAKPRLKWTPQLHRRFVDAVKQLGGPEKATPKSLMRVMGIQGLTLYHLKSHLQKYRVGRSQPSSSQSIETESSKIVTSKKSNAEKTNEVQVAEALKMQMEVQKKLHQQIEVQKHLQLRMEAQGRYLQSVLKKAEETLSGYRACSIEAERARAQLSHLASMVDSGCTTSVMTDSDASMLVVAADKIFAGCSFESSLTSSENSHEKGINDNPVLEKRKRDDIDLNLNEFDSGPRPRGIDLNSDGTF